MSSVSEGSGPAGRSTATISVAQTAPIRIHHLTENLCADDPFLRRLLPEVASQTLVLCARPSADARLFEETLARDPALAGQVILLAGAGLFAPRASILSVREAVLHLGLEAMRDALMMIVANGLALRAPGFEALGETLRRRALAAGIAARLGARSLRVESGNDFLVGLLHDVGEVVLVNRCIEEGILPQGLLDDETDGPVVRETIHQDHPRVSAAICRAWRLPAPVIEAAEFHHDYKGGRKPRLAAQLAAASDIIATHVTSTAPAGDPAASPVLTEAGFPAPVVAAIISEVTARLPAFAAAGSTAQPPR